MSILIDLEFIYDNYLMKMIIEVILHKKKKNSTITNAKFQENILEFLKCLATFTQENYKAELF